MRSSSFLIILISTLALLQLTMTGTTSYGSPGFHTVSYPGGNAYTKIELVLASSADVGSVIMIVKNSPQTPTFAELQFSNYQHASSTASDRYDLQNANIGQTQTVQANLGASADTFHVYVINFQSQGTITYTLNTVDSANSTSLCAFGTPLSTSLYCSSCLTSIYIGSYCRIYNSQVLKDITYLVQLQPYTNAQNFVSFTIPGQTNKVTLYYSSTSVDVINFIQFKEYDSQIAGWLNHVLNGGLNLINKANTKYSVTINSDGKDVAVSFWNKNGIPVNINVWYTVDQGTNILIIILAVLGGVLFILLIIVAIYIVRRMNSNELRQVQPGSPLRQSLVRKKNTDNMLTTDQIDIYFPSVLCRNVCPEEQNSSDSLLKEMKPKSNQEIENAERDCVICLCPVGPTDMMKVTYCKHLFHAHCLAEWFKKNRNCPYCRQEFNKKSTMEHYQNLLKITNKTILVGVDLAAEILKPRVSQKSSIIIQDIKD